MSFQLSDYHYDLPEELIASHPLEKRDASRMMIVDRASGRITHSHFREFPDVIRPSDLVVLNDTKVIRARLVSANGRTEVLLLENTAPRTWKAMVKPGRRFREEAEVEIGGTTVRVVSILPGGERLLEFAEDPDLAAHGEMPVPPYFHRRAEQEDDERYQTVYAKNEGSVAAPTAGLHFTPEVLARIPHVFLTLHVGAGTFLPVKTDDVRQHVMHEERFIIPAETAHALNAAQRRVAIGTTVTRVLESQPDGPVRACEGRTDIFIHPPYAFRRVGALLTNFHLPCSTLIMLVSAMAGRELILEAYAKAVEERYRFFSYGDCMLIV
ncbi:MAG: tRNA preQ1(34) S-adenosylmethionine ribosyltransferase-isomerase QueA [Terrimicrobiaceae bacterium]|nr:tRNA preQ1(34) S-adenosylmethionine ribosyltransferase-isomerase QueA [Terrimicrobiaceae bacterium]